MQIVDSTFSSLYLTMHTTTRSLRDANSSVIPSRPKILVVDDEPMHIQVLYQAFSGDYQVFMATTGEQALEFCKNTPPDLVLLDMVMAGMGGLEVCARLKADEKTSFVPVIFVSSQTGAHHVAQALEPGAVDFVSKPVNTSVLKARIKAHLATKFQTDLLRTMASLDPLTGVFNRRDFEQRLDSEWKRSVRSGTALSLVILDIDHFEAFSKSCDWLEADNAIKQVAEILKAHFRRPADMVSRYGKSVFTCLAPETGHADALKIGERVISEFHCTLNPNEDSTTSQTILLSAGLVTREGTTTGEAWKLFELAEQQLRLAQLRGGNSIGEAILSASLSEKRDLL